MANVFKNLCLEQNRRHLRFLDYKDYFGTVKSLVDSSGGVCVALLIMLIKVFRLISRIILAPLVLVFPLAGTGKVFVVADVIQIGPFRLA